jgi:hypothetical protein
MTHLSHQNLLVFMYAHRNCQIEIRVDITNLLAKLIQVGHCCVSKAKPAYAKTPRISHLSNPSKTGQEKSNSGRRLQYYLLGRPRLQCALHSATPLAMRKVASRSFGSCSFSSGTRALMCLARLLMDLSRVWQVRLFWFTLSIRLNVYATIASAAPAQLRFWALSKRSHTTCIDAEAIIFALSIWAMTACPY